jgi:L-lactate dehydrogenase complex protein LldG
MPARDEILNRLRSALERSDLPFPAVDPPVLTGVDRMAVTQASGGMAELGARFCQELRQLGGTAEVVESAAEARLALINCLIEWREADEALVKGTRLRTGQEDQVLAWEPQALPIESIAEALADVGFTLVSPRELGTIESRNAVRHIRYGLTGVEAAFAATGSMFFVSGPETLRSASLLPLRHVALAPLSRLHPNMEAWLIERRERDLVSMVRGHSQLTLITGPSKSADIEMNLTLGVHGPKFVHVILFDDMSEPSAPYYGNVTYDPAEDEDLPQINPFARVDQIKSTSNPKETS